MIQISGDKAGRPVFKDRIKLYEYEIIFLVFLLSRFVFKNILGLANYFTNQPIFRLSDTLCIVLGAAVVLAVCICLAYIFGRVIRKNKTDFEKPVLILVALFLSCPATIPFLFDSNSLSGTQMLYPFALFVFSVFFIGKPVIEWLVPFICAVYFIPALFTSEVFFTALRKGAILYVPLLLLLIFLNMTMKKLEPDSRHTKTQKKVDSARKNLSVGDRKVFVVSLLTSTCSYIYTLTSGKFYWGESFYNTGQPQRINGYLLVCLLITSPLLFAFGIVLSNAVKNKYPTFVSSTFWYALILLFPIFWNNYYGLWIPFLTISLSAVVFFSIWKKNSATLSAVCTIDYFFTKHQFLLYFLLIAMTSLSNTSTVYNSVFLSKIFQNIFNNVPF